MVAPMQTIPAKTIVSGYSEEGWFGSNYNMNIYKGCSHGCIYCDSRSECYRVEDFDTVRAKENALQVIARDLKSKRRAGIVITGAMSDLYNPMEREYELTRGALRLIDKYGFGIVIDTKSDDEEHLQRVFRRECDRLGLLYRMKDISVGIRRGYFEDRQIRLV